MIKVKFDPLCVKYRKLGFLVTNSETKESFYLEDYPDHPKVKDEKFLRHGIRLAKMLEDLANQLYKERT